MHHMLDRIMKNEENVHTASQGGGGASYRRDNDIFGRAFRLSFPSSAPPEEQDQQQAISSQKCRSRGNYSAEGEEAVSGAAGVHSLRIPEKCRSGLAD